MSWSLFNKLHPPTSPSKVDAYLSANAWTRCGDGYGWRDPLTFVEYGVRESAANAQALHELQVLMQHVGWRMAWGGATARGIWTVAEAFVDPAPAPGQRQVCSVWIAIRRLRERGQWPAPMPVDEVLRRVP